jgi:hypothetical protein
MKDTRQRELRDAMAAVMDMVVRGETFRSTRHGTVVAELRLAVSGGFVGSPGLTLAFAHLPRWGLDALRADADAVFGEDRIGGRAPGTRDAGHVVDIDGAALPLESTITVVTPADLSQGPHLAASPKERAARLERLQVVEAVFRVPLPLAPLRHGATGPVSRSCSGRGMRCVRGGST